MMQMLAFDAFAAFLFGLAAWVLLKRGPECRRSTWAACFILFGAVFLLVALGAYIRFFMHLAMLL